MSEHQPRQCGSQPDAQSQTQESRREQIESAIASITATLKGPLNNVERAWLVEDRRELRAELANGGAK